MRLQITGRGAGECICVWRGHAIASEHPSSGSMNIEPEYGSEPELESRM